MRIMALTALLMLTPSVFAQIPTHASPKPNAGNRLAYLDEMDLYYPNRHFPKFTTPQWVGEEGVDAVVVLAIDDMRDPKKYEAFLRPILRRLQQIDGRAPVSIMTCKVDPKDPQLQTWLNEGLSLECHTVDHPCPFFKIGFDKAKKTYDDCVDMMHQIPNNRPVAFRMPCCDSLNTPSPRFLAEIFHRSTAKGNYLTLDSSVFNVFTADDPEIPKNLVQDEKGRERFRSYLPADRAFVNLIENYPYPYLNGTSCWQFPCVTPSDWLAQHRQKPNNHLTLRDWKAALDITVLKKGVFNLVFHPHGWIKNDQVIELIDYAVERHGKKVKFLTFREAADRLNKAVGTTNDATRMSLHMLDLNGDGFLDVWHARAASPHFQLWSPQSNRWSKLPAPAVDPGDLGIFGAKLGFLQSTKEITLLNRYLGAPADPLPVFQQAWKLDREWHKLADWTKTEPLTKPDSPGAFFWLRDIDGDGISEIVYPDIGKVFGFSVETKSWKAWPDLPTFDPDRLPEANRDGLRLVDLDGDGNLDVIFADDKSFGIYLFAGQAKGWSRKVIAGMQGEPNALPPIVRRGMNNGFFVHSGYLWWANETTAILKDHVDRRKIADLLAPIR